MSVVALVDTRHQFFRVFDVYVPIAIGVFALIVTVTIVTVVVFRGRPPERAARWRENNRLEGTYAGLLACVAVFLIVLTFSAEHQVDTVANTERPALVVNVVGAKWEWEFGYPAYGFGVHSGTVGRQPLVVPAGEPVRFRLQAQDVIHAFWIPEVRYKHDLIPGSTQVTTLDFSRPGVFAGQCAEFCGLRHADMVFAVHVVSPQRFTAWARSGGRGPVP